MTETRLQRTTTDPRSPRTPGVPLGPLDLIRLRRSDAYRVSTALKIIGAISIALGLIIGILAGLAGGAVGAAVGFSSAISGSLFLAASSGLRLLAGISWLLEERMPSPTPRPAPEI